MELRWHVGVPDGYSDELVSAAKGLALAPDPIALQLVQQLPSKPLAAVWQTIGALSIARYGAAVSTDGAVIYVTHGYTNQVLSSGLVVTPSGTVTGTTNNATTARQGVAGAWCNGKHYAIGGRTSGNQSTPVVEAYTPAGANGASGTWATVASLPFAIEYGSAATIGTRIYYAGGYTTTSGEVMVNLFRYDTVANTWTTLANMPAARTQGAMVAIGTKLYYFGGLDSSGNQVNTVYIFDTVAGTWSTGTAMATGSLNKGSGVAINGLAYVYGYSGSTGTYVLRSYEPATQVMSAVTSPTSHGDYAGVTAIGSSLYVVSGTTTANVDVFDTRAITELAPAAWSTVAALSSARYGAAVSTDGTNIYATHGYGTTTVASGQVVTPAGGFAILPSAAVARQGVAGAFCNGKHYAIGGLNSGGAPVGTVEAYAPAGTNGAAGTWSNVTSMTATYGAYCAAAVVGQFIYVAGGQAGGGTGNGVGSTLQRFDTVAGTWATLANMPAARTQGALVAVGSKLYYLGGVLPSGSVAYDVFVFDTVAGTWSTAAPVPGSVYVLAAAAVGTRVHCYTYTGGVPGLSVYDIGANTWSNGTTPPTHGGFAAVVAIGAVLYLVSGQSTANVDTFDTAYVMSYVRKLRAAKSYLLATDPVLGALACRLPEVMPTVGWSTIGALPALRYEAAVSTDGTYIYSTAGTATGSSGNSAVYAVNASTGAVVVNGSTAPGYRATAGAFFGGKHLQIGGYDGTALTAQVSAYTPNGTSLGTWANLASLPAARMYVAAAVLGGFLYVAGGQSGSGVATAQSTLYRFDGTTWITLAAMPAARTQGAMVAVGTKLYYLGGLDTSGSASSAIYIFDTVAGAWSTSPFTLAAGGSWARGGLIGNVVYFNSSAIVRSFDLLSGVETVLASTPSTHGKGAGVVAIGSTVYVVSGDGTANVDKLDPVSGPNFTRDVGLVKQLALAGPAT